MCLFDDCDVDGTSTFVGVVMPACLFASGSACRSLKHRPQHNFDSIAIFIDTLATNFIDAGSWGLGFGFGGLGFGVWDK